MKYLTLAALCLAVNLSAAQGEPPRQDAQRNFARPVTNAAIGVALDRSVATLTNAKGAVTGVSALIDAKGLFLAHATAVTEEQLVATLNGKLLNLQRVSLDEQTQLVLLQAQEFKLDGATPVRVARESSKPGETVYVATASGAMRSEVMANNRPGQVSKSLRYLPLEEIRMERTPEQIGGGMVFNSKGELVGVLGATLAPVQTAKMALGGGGGGEAGVVNTGASATGGSRGSGSGQVPGGQALDGQFGPRGLTVGYALGPTLLRRVVTGFRTESHRVEHPSIGVFFREANRQGALIDLVKEGSPAAQAGIRAGDLVVEADGKPIKTPVDFGTILFNQDVGGQLRLKILRENVEFSVIVTVGPAQVLALIRM